MNKDMWYKRLTEQEATQKAWPMTLITGQLTEISFFSQDEPSRSRHCDGLEGLQVIKNIFYLAK